MASGELSASPGELRDRLEDLILAELHGPAGGEQEELADARVSERYLLGMLAPRKPAAEDATVDEELAVTGGTDGEEGTPEPVSPAIEHLFPSSFGLTFAVDPGVDDIEVEASWGAYDRQRSEADPDAGGNVWKREPAGGKQAVAMKPGEIAPLHPDPDQPDVIVRGRSRDYAGQRLVTLFLVNGQVEPETNKDSAWLFQAQLRVRDSDGAPIFVRRAPAGVGTPDVDADEQRAIEMLYRDQVELASGHGVGVHVERAPDDPTRAIELRTEAVPACDVPQTTAPSVEDVPELKGAVLDMRKLADAPTDALPAMLDPLVAAYEAWMDAQRARISDPQSRLTGFEDTAEAALARCAAAAKRIQAGINALRDPNVAEAFRFANEAMWRQRVHTLAAERRRRTSETLEEALVAETNPANHSWRPFQLAFLLTSMPALGSLDHSERLSAVDGNAIVDLLWFPTGGGKTEAYLGLIAFTLAIRRLEGEVNGHDGGEGVGVLMRYTLRLLTLQQFQRATAMVCAMELMRRERASAGDERWGSTPFRIGLWVGQRSTPNRTDDAETWVANHRAGKAHLAGGANSPAQLARCPWCGTEIDPGKHIEVDMVRRRTNIYCGDRVGGCEYSRKRSPGEGLPAVVVDEEVYRLLPGLVIATVDKFAQMPWNGAVQTLFGRVAGRCERHGFRWPVHPDDRGPDWEANSHPPKGDHPAAKTIEAGPLRPPDLIVQDELHLISGPLGSLVGIYETAVDRLCSWDPGAGVVRPKVIASTATIRRADYQVHQLFWRSVRVFPPSGLDARDSFFAVRRDRAGDETRYPGRRYLGICAQGRRLKNVLIRVYVAQMAAAQYLLEREPTADTYMTLVGYFNSLRELGGMRRLVEDDVTTRLGKMGDRGLVRRSRPLLEELTSRRSASEIPRILDRLGIEHKDPRPEKREGDWPLDVLLATNMISVGVDVPRLGTMVCAGQPKSTSEYIQATSRIGRATPGLVLTVYHWARPRDLSHYESFEHYHSTFYGQVEALSVTPFASRAMFRGLTGVLASLLRLEGLDWSPNLGAEGVDRKAELATSAREAIVARAEALSSDAATGQFVDATLGHRLDQWEKEQKHPGRRLGYKATRDGKTYGLLKDPQEGRWGDWTVPNSLREVEPAIRMLLRPRAGGPLEPPAWSAPTSASDSEDSGE